MQSRPGADGRRTTTDSIPSGDPKLKRAQVTMALFAFELFDGETGEMLNREGIGRIGIKCSSAPKTRVLIRMRACREYPTTDYFDLDIHATGTRELPEESGISRNGLSVLVSGRFHNPESDTEQDFALLYNPEETHGIFRGTVPTS